MENINEFMNINIEQEFWGDFVLEAFEHLEDIETNVITLEQNPEDMEIIHTMFRAFHTIKGLSGFVEHTLIQEIAHKTETMMDLCRKQELKVSKDVVDSILGSADYIKHLCEDMDSVKDPEYVAKILSHVQFLEKVANPAEHTENEATEESTVIHSEQEEQNHEDVVSVEHQELPYEQNSDEVSGVEEVQIAEENNAVDNIEEHVEENAFETQQESPQESVVEQSTASEEIVKEEKIIEKITAREEVKTVVETPQAPKRPMLSNEEHMKVANSKIDYLVDMIGELIINQSLIEQHIEQKYSTDHELVSEMGSFSGITRELQNLSMSLRMVSLKPTFQKITRIARDTISELSKNVEFVTSGENTEIDRVVTDKLLDPLVHLVKNAISHGVEENENDRIAKNKSPKARVELNAYNKRGKIYIEVRDDGRGIDTKVVYQKALEKGLVDPAKNYTDEEIREFINADSLHYLSVEGLVKATTSENSYCLACLNGEYPMEVPNKNM